MPYRKSTYSAAQNSNWRGRIAIILAEANREMTIPEIQEQDLVIRELSPQKIARLITELVDYGLVKRGHNTSGRTTYVSLGELAN